MTPISFNGTRYAGLGAIALAALVMSGCTRDWKPAPVSMWNESRYKPYEATSFFADQSTSRPSVQGTVARGQLRTDEQFFNGTKNGVLTTQMPFPATKAVLERGKERYNIYCAPCHGDQGVGNGMIVQRGFSKPPDYIEPRLIDAPIGHFYDVITNGYGSMYSYASRVPPRDRWAIAAYIRVLQRSRTATINDVPANARQSLPNDLAPAQTTAGKTLNGTRPGPNAMSNRPEEGVGNANSSTAAPAAPVTTNQPSMTERSQPLGAPVVPGAGRATEDARTQVPVATNDAQ